MSLKDMFKKRTLSPQEDQTGRACTKSKGHAP